MNNEMKKAMTDKMKSAIANGDTEDFINELTDSLTASVEDEVKKEVMARYNELGEQAKDVVLLKNGNTVSMNKEEKDFYNKLVGTINNASEDFSIVLPVTIENRVFENIKVEHPLLAAINFVDSKGVTKWIITKDLDYAASWGDLGSAISTEAKKAFAAVEFSNYKLSAWMPIPDDMLALGVTWIDQFVTEYLTEVIARKMEDAIINGTGQKMPVGMIMTVDIESQTVPAVAKTATKITDLSTTTVGEIAAALTNNGTRMVGRVDLIVNPIDYWKIIYPALFYVNENGEVRQSNLPVNVYQSLAVASGKMVAGLLPNYFATIGFGGASGKVTYSDQYHFLEDERVFKAKCLAYGTPVDNVSFNLYDISGVLEAAVPTRSQKTKVTG